MRRIFFCGMISDIEVNILGQKSSDLELKNQPEKYVIKGVARFLFVSFFLFPPFIIIY